MTTATLTKPRAVMEVLRGDPSSRRPADTNSAAGLRAELEDGIFSIIGNVQLTTPLLIRSSDLRAAPATTDLGSSPLGKLRGVLLMQVLRLQSVGVTTQQPFDDALDAWRSEQPGELAIQFDQLSADERARLATDVTAHALTLLRTLGDVPRHWPVRTMVRASQRLAGGSVLVSDVVDLVVGSPKGAVASVALLDVTSAPLGANAERVARFHALLQTLRTGEVPRCTCALSTATGELWSIDVNHELLARSTHELLDTIRYHWSQR